MTSTYAVTGVLERRRVERESALVMRCTAIALAVHGLAVLTAWALPRLRQPERLPIEYVAVQVVPAARLGVERPRPAAPPPPAAPAKPEPKPPAPPDIAPPKDTPALPQPSAVKAPPKPAPAAEAKPAAVDAAVAEPEVQGSARGSANALALGAAVAGLDNPDFVYGYYVDQMLAMIQRNWVRPMVGSGVEATVHYRIGRDGRISDVRIATSSGINSFDLAALRAVQASTPLPPLPRAFREGSLGVNLIFR